MLVKRVFIIVLDSVGIGEMPDSSKYGDQGSNTLKACYDSGKLYIPNMQKLGIYNIDGIDFGVKVSNPLASFAKMTEASAGKDTTVGHWEIAGIISSKPLPTYPDGFPENIIKQFEQKTGKQILCNKPYSGTDVIMDYGQEHVKTEKLIVYTSADSVFQIAAHEDIIPIKKLYEYCQIARDILKGDCGVGRVIARPFTGEYPNYKRTSNRHDFSLSPPCQTILDYIQSAGLRTVGIGKINDIFAGKGVSYTQSTISNDDGMEKTFIHIKEDFKGLCFVNLVDFDMLYGHRNDVMGYTKALNRFDLQLGEMLNLINDDDVIMITADHGCDPSTPSTDHSREYTPFLIYGKHICKNMNLGTRSTFADIGVTATDLLGVKAKTDGMSLVSDVFI